MSDLKAECEELREQIESLKTKVGAAQGRLRHLEDGCAHVRDPQSWENIEPRIVNHPGYSVPLERHGSDIWGGVDVPPSREVFYRRRCRYCGKVQETNLTTEEKHVTHKPVW